MTAEQNAEITKLLIAEIAKLPRNVAAPRLMGHFHGQTEVGIELWFTNPKTGNKSLYVIETYAPEATAAHLKAAMGKANARDKATLARFAAIKAVDAE